MQKERDFYYHYIPKVDRVTKAGNKSKDLKIIGIIDASYSMIDVWKMMAVEWNRLVNDVGEEFFTTITFDNRLHHNKDTPFLTERINDHGGNSTNIKISFDYIEKEIFPTLPSDTEIKIIFISDGQDNQNGGRLEHVLDELQGGNGRDISFLCLGVLSGFPTFISMKLRAKYHTGDETIPSIFLIEYASDKAFFNKFQSIREYMKTKDPIPIEPAQLFFPWQGLNDTAKEGQWIFSKDKVITLLPPDQEPIKLEYKTFNVEAVSEIIRSWVQKLQLDCLNRKLTHNETVEYAQSTKTLVDSVLAEVEQFEGINLLNKATQVGLSYYKKVLNQQVAHSRTKVEGYLTDLSELIKGNTPQKMNEFEAAKMIGLGTIVGKYQQKALALKNIPREEFMKIKDEFIAVLAKLQPVLDAKDGAVGLRSVKNQLTFTDLLKDKTLVDGLNLLNSQYDLLETFPLVGLGFNLKRFERSINIAYMVKVNKILKSDIASRVIDTVYMSENPDFIQSHEGLEVNCVLPLLDSSDSDIAEIFETRMFKLLMTWNVMLNIDRVDDEAYMSLLSTVYISLMDQTDADSQDLKAKIFNTVGVLYKSGGSFTKLIDALEQDNNVIFGDKDNEKILSKIILAVDYMISRKMLDEDEQEEILEKTWVEYFAKRLQEKDTDLQKIVTLDYEKDVIAKSIKSIEGRKILEKFWTSREIVRKVDANFHKNTFNIKFSSKSGNKACINESGLREDHTKKINWALMKLWNKAVTGEEVDNNKAIAYICAALKFNDVTQRANAALSFDENFNNETIGKYLLSGNASDTKKTAHRIKTQILAKAKVMYFTEFQNAHMNTKPLSWEFIVDYCAQNNIDHTQLRYAKESKLVLNACQSPDCPHFLKANSKSLRDHLGGWQEKMPRGFHLFVSNHLSQTDEEIFDQYSKERGITDFSHYNTTKDKVLDYIKLVKEGYAV